MVANMGKVVIKILPGSVGELTRPIYLPVASLL